jgi:hypothetical protein
MLLMLLDRRLSNFFVPFERIDVGSSDWVAFVWPYHSGRSQANLLDSVFSPFGIDPENLCLYSQPLVL